MNITEEIKFEDTNICLLVLVGIPGSGKTELCKLIKSKLNRETEDNFQILHLCYDDLIIKKITNDGEWRKARDNILESVKISVEKLDKNNGKVIVLIDDNMYYQSMRRMYYRLAKKEHYAFCQLYLACEKNIALERIKSREIQEGDIEVTEEIVDRIEEKLEVPNTSSNWEVLTLKVDTNHSNFHYKVNDSFGEKPLLTAIHQLLHSAFEKCKNVLKQSIPQQEIQGSNCLQELDIALRKSISQKIQTALSSGAKSQDLKHLSQNLNSERKLQLKVASQNSNLSAEVIANIVKDFMKS